MKYFTCSMNLFPKFSYLFVIINISLTLFSASALATDQSTLTTIKIKQTQNNPNDFNAILNFNHKVDYSVFILPHPERLVIDVKNCRTAVKADQVNLGLCPISKIRIGIQNGYNLRLVYDLETQIKPQALFVPSANNDGGKLIVKLNEGHQHSINSSVTGAVLNDAAAVNTSLPISSMNSHLHKHKIKQTQGNSAQRLEVNQENNAQSSGVNQINNAQQLAVNQEINSQQPATPVNNNASQQAQQSTDNSDGDEADMINQLTVIEDQNSLKKYSGSTTGSPDTYNVPLLSAGGGNRPVIVVIDAGHGGKDPGATGPNGVHEKNVTLAIARDLEEMVDQQKGMHAVMTRDGDYYVGLRDRLAIARKDKGDIFIAIHADAAPELAGEATGASVFALSLHGASSEAARWIAEKENYSELGGIDLDNIPDQDNTLRSVLIDLSQTATISDSLILGGAVLHQLGELSPLHHNVVEQAPFMVLKSPDIPSILVETGFITTPYEERHLQDPIYQHALAHALLGGVKSYFNHYAPPGTWLASAGNKTEIEG